MLHWNLSAGWSPEQWCYFNSKQHHHNDSPKTHRLQHDEARSSANDFEQRHLNMKHKNQSDAASASLKSKDSSSAAAGSKQPPINHSSDVFSWGLIVVELFTGRFVRCVRLDVEHR